MNPILLFHGTRYVVYTVPHAGRQSLYRTALSGVSVTSRVTDDDIARLRAKIGEEVSISEPPYLTEMTHDAIRHWAWATGDRNPLFLSADYARQSSHGTVIAPPTMLYAFSRLSIGYRGGLPGVHSMFGGSTWHWKRPITVGEHINTEVRFKDLIELPSRFAGRMFKQVSLVRFLTDSGEEVAHVETWGMRTERDSARQKGKYEALSLQQYTPEELRAVGREYALEACRGSDSLYWEDVREGDEPPSIIRGPYTSTIAVAFEQAWGGLFIRAHGYWFDLLDRHPALGLPNGQGVPEPPEAVHWDSALAQSVGVPAAYDYGPERISWIATMLTNWCGDTGELTHLHCETRRFNLLGDLTRCHARVVGKAPLADDRGAVQLEVWAEDQRHQQTVRGTATVTLPRRG